MSKTFFDHLSSDWGYLLTDNLLFWKSRLESFAEAIRLKCGSLETNPCLFPASNIAGGFCIFGFIDNTMNATCRPGGGPTRDGANATRNDPNLQRAWYNGWKKLHGFKWQTVDLPNGMNFHVWGPKSVRHNDLFMLDESRINQLLAELQTGENLQFKVYGDSAYIVVNETHIRARHYGDNLSPRQILENRALSSCREIIEWDYGDVGKYWAYVNFRNALKMRKSPVGQHYFVALLLRNAYVTMNGCNTARYFNIFPPTFEEWVSAGPRVNQINMVVG